MLSVENDHRGVLWLTIDRPQVRNAINDELIRSLNDVFDRLDPSVRVVVLASVGPAFCAGGDLEWMRKAASYSEAQNAADARELSRLLESMVNCPAVIIARVQGAAYGGGCGLVAAADVAIASTDAQFAFSEVRLGLVPATISRIVIPKIGAGNARALFSTGEAFDAARALRISLVHEVVPPDLLDTTVERAVTTVLAAGPRAVAISKQLAGAPPLGVDESAALLATTRASDEGREGVSAFLEKRKPSFHRSL